MKLFIQNSSNVFGSLPFDILIKDTFIYNNISVIIQCYCANTDEVSRLSFTTAGKKQELFSLTKPLMLGKLKIILNIFIVSVNKFASNCIFVNIYRQNLLRKALLLCCASPTNSDTFLTLLKITLVGGRPQITYTGINPSFSSLKFNSMFSPFSRLQTKY